MDKLKTIAILFVLTALIQFNYGKSLRKKADFLAFSKDNRYAFFKVLNGNKLSAYIIYDMKREKIARLYNTKTGFERWQSFIAKTPTLRGIKSKTYKGYSVEVKYTKRVFEGKQMPGSGSGMYFDLNKENAVLKQKKCVFYLVFDSKNVYKKTPLFSSAFSSYAAMPDFDFKVWWGENLRSVAVAVIWKIRAYAYYETRYKVFALSW